MSHRRLVFAPCRASPSTACTHPGATEPPFVAEREPAFLSIEARIGVPRPRTACPIDLALASDVYVSGGRLADGGRGFPASEPKKVEHGSKVIADRLLVCPSRSC